MARVKVRVIVKNGSVQITYPEIGQKCYDIGKNIRKILSKQLQLSDEQVKPLSTSTQVKAKKVSL